MQCKYILNKDAKRYFLAVLIAFFYFTSRRFSLYRCNFLQYLKFDFKKAITIVGLTVLSGSGLFAILKFIIKYTPYAFYFTLNSVELNEIVASQSSILIFLAYRLLLDTTIIQKKKRLIQKLNCFTICRLSH